MYNILWIDDQYECLSELMERCEVMHGFKITKCRFAKEGMEIFEKNLEKWSAVVLDAKVLMETEDEVPNLEGLRYSRDRINELSHRRFVPIFVFTGQPDLTSSENFGAMVDKFYSKGDDDDQLIKDIITASDKLPETQIVHRYKQIFNAWPGLYHDLIRILTVLEKEDWSNNSVLTDIRKILSDIFEDLYERGYMTIVHDKSNISDCSRDIGSPARAKYVPTYIARYFHALVDITNQGSHRLKVDKDVKDLTAPYLVRSLIYELLTVLHWVSTLPDKANCELVRKLMSEEMAEYNRKQEARKA